MTYAIHRMYKMIDISEQRTARINYNHCKLEFKNP